MDVFERKPEAPTVPMVEHIRRSALIKCVLSGHTHKNTEILGLGEKDQIVTGLDTLREITVI